MRIMTTLSNNIRSMRKLSGLTQDVLGKACGVSGSAVSQWEANDNPTMPEIDHLLTMSGLFKITVEQLVHADDLENCQTLSASLDNEVLEKVFHLLSVNPSVDNALLKANIKRKTYMFGLLYAICEDIDAPDIENTQLSGMAGTSSEIENESTSEKSPTVTGKQRKNSQ